MTFSIVARDGDAYGVAVASKFLAVGAAVPAAAVGAGALATQAYANLTYRAAGLDLLRAGRPAAEVVSELTDADQGRNTRQLGVVGPDAGATFTGTAAPTWAGGRAGADYAVQGNILVGEAVVEALERAWTAAGAQPLAERLVAALRAGDEAGGDRRGRQSAALLVVRPGGGYGGDDTEIDLRVDDHTDPVAELARLLVLQRLYFGEPDESTLLDLSGDTADEVRRLLVGIGFTDADLDVALNNWAGVANFEERMRPGRIDPLVLEQLRAGVT